MNGFLCVEWLSQSSGWRAFSLGSFENEKEEIVNVPGASSTCLMQLLIQLGSTIDHLNGITKNVF